MPTWRNFSGDLWPCRQTPWRDWKRSSAPPRASRRVLGGGITNHNFRARFGGARGGGAAAGQRHRAARLRPLGRSARRTRWRRRPGSRRRSLAHLEDPVVPGHRASSRGRRWRRAELREPRALAEVAAALRTIHGCGAIGARFDAFRLVEDYAAATRARGGEVPAAYERAHAAAARIEAAPALAERRPGPLPRRPPPRQLHRHARRDPDRRLGVRGDGQPLVRPRQLRRQQRARPGRGGGFLDRLPGRAADAPPTSPRCA